MKKLKFTSIAILITIHFYAQQKLDNKAQINSLIEKYSRSVIEKDSIVFYDLFNTDNVTWCGAITERSQAKEIEKKGVASERAYFSGSYKGFLRGLFHYQFTEDKFDNIAITEDGTVASVTMDYSFWANNKMTNWGEKYLTLIKRNGKWKITSVIYSLDLIDYYQQPSPQERQKLKQKSKRYN